MSPIMASSAAAAVLESTAVIPGRDMEADWAAAGRLPPVRKIDPRTKTKVRCITSPTGESRPFDAGRDGALLQTVILSREAPKDLRRVVSNEPTLLARGS